jgi:2-amino-4-hydroxy-6-hydroxymethyldihydropteridine diphosphokinase
MIDVAYVALGSNLGDRHRNLADARERIAAIPGVVVLRASRVDETAPIGPPGQGAYLNQMLAVQTNLSPPALLLYLHEIEDAGGRERHVRWGPRTIDLDIVRYDHMTWNTPELIVPHPELLHRPFWQTELDEVMVASSPAASGVIPSSPT